MTDKLLQAINAGDRKAVLEDAEKRIQRMKGECVQIVSFLDRIGSRKAADLLDHAIGELAKASLEVRKEL